MTETPALYDELADWWPLLSAPEEYRAEAAEYLRLLRGSVDVGREAFVGRRT